MKDSSQLRFSVGEARDGLVDYTVTIGNQTCSARVTNLGAHPLEDLIHAAVETHWHYHVEPIEGEAAWECVAMDEPGAIVVRVVAIEGERLKISVFQDHETAFWGADEKRPEMPLRMEGEVNFLEFAESVFATAADALAKQGLLGLREGWLPDRWDVGCRYQVFPLEQFLYLAGLVAPDDGAKEGLRREVAILERALRNN